MVLQIKHVVVVGGGESGEKGYHRRIYPKTFTTIPFSFLLFLIGVVLARYVRNFGFESKYV